MQTTIAIPEALQRLPVAKQLGTIDFSQQNFVARAATGSGKTMVLPAHEALLRKSEPGCIAIRQPTKVTSSFVASGLKSLWSPLGLKVAILNRDVAPGSKVEDECRIADIVVISDGSLNRLSKLQPIKCFYADEAHWLSLNAELDIAIAKKRSIPLRFLSATVDEVLFLNYLGKGTGNYLLEGRSFPIEKHVIWCSPEVFKRDNHDELYLVIATAVAFLRRDGESAIFFLPTRQMCEDASKHFEKAIPTTFVHGGVSPIDAERWVDKHAGQPFIVFATTAAATGITLDLHSAYIADEIIDSTVEFGIERQSSGPMGDNMLLQAAGRAGRIRAGNAYLITHEGHRQDDDPWAMVQPRPIQPPSEKATPFEVVLTMASHGITDDEDIDLLGDINPEEFRHARQWLRANGCLKADNTLTPLGRQVASFPMSAQQAHLILSAPSKRASLVLLAAFTLGAQGIYGLLKVKPRSRQLAERRAENAAFQLLNPAFVVPYSLPMSLAKIMQAVFRLDDNEVYKWCDAHNFWAKPIMVAKKDFNENGKFIIDSGAKRALVASNLDDQTLINEVHGHLKRHPLYRHNMTIGGKVTGGRPGFFDSAFADAFGIEGTFDSFDCWSIPKIVRKGNFVFTSLDMGLLEPRVELEAEYEEPHP